MCSSTHTCQRNTSAEQNTTSSGAWNEHRESKFSSYTGKGETHEYKCPSQEKADILFKDTENRSHYLYKDDDTTIIASARNKGNRSTSRSSKQFHGTSDRYSRGKSHTENELRESRSPHSKQNHRIHRCCRCHSQDIKSHRNIKRSRSPSREREKCRKLMRRFHCHNFKSCSSKHSHGCPSECVARQRTTRYSRSSSLDTESYSSVSIKRDRSLSQDSQIQRKYTRKTSPVRDNSSSHRSSRSPHNRPSASLDR